MEDRTVAIDEARRDAQQGSIKSQVAHDRAVGRARGVARFSQVVDYVFYVIYTLLLVRLALALIAANSSNGFVQLIRTITNPLYAMFRGIVESPTAEGGGTLALPIIIAIVAYIVLHGIIRGLLHLVANRRTQI